MLGRGLDDRLRCEAGVEYETAVCNGHQRGLANSPPTLCKDENVLCGRFFYGYCRLWAGIIFNAEKQTQTYIKEAITFKFWFVIAITD